MPVVFQAKRTLIAAVFIQFYFILISINSVYAEPPGLSLTEEDVVASNGKPLWDSKLIDYGAGPQVRTDEYKSYISNMKQNAKVSAFAVGAAEAAVAPSIGGSFRPPFSWGIKPNAILPIAISQLPDGRVFSYGTGGTDPDGGDVLGASEAYSFWDPNEPDLSIAHFLLFNDSVNRTNTFCAGQAYNGLDNKIVMASGTVSTPTQSNLSTKDTTVIDLNMGSRGQVVSVSPMKYERWYPSLVTLPNGNMVVLGGRLRPYYPAIFPEVYNRTTGKWTTMSGLNQTLLKEAFGAPNDTTNRKDNWYYPRAYVSPIGTYSSPVIFILGHDGSMFQLTIGSTSGSTTQGMIKKLTPQGGILPGGSGPTLPVAIYAPGKLFALRYSNRAVSIDINAVDSEGKIWPKVTVLERQPYTRLWANATVLADGRVLITGGSTIKNKIDQGVVTKMATVWDPKATGDNTFTDGAEAEKFRLYHSTALLLMDGSVITAGGGFPGPVLQLNGEIYDPSYLFNADGTKAERPVIDHAPEFVNWNSTFNVEVQGGVTISKVTLVRMGTVTHSYDSDQRFMQLQLLSQNGSQLTVNSPANPRMAPSGYYMLFVFNSAGVPSVAKPILIKSK